MMPRCFWEFSLNLDLSWCFPKSGRTYSTQPSTTPSSCQSLWPGSEMQWIANLITPRSSKINVCFNWCSIIIENPMASFGIQWHPIQLVIKSASSAWQRFKAKLGVGIRLSDGCCKWVPFYSEIGPWIEDPRIPLRTCGSTCASLYPDIPHILIIFDTS